MKIKIRAFDIFTMRMVTEESSGLKSSQILSRYSHCELFTGLKDKNGKEIYEGDILSQGDLFFVVTFGDGCFQIKGNENQGTNQLNQFRAARFEIVGNMYETPELLTVK